METRPRLLRITTVPISLKILLHGQLSFFQKHAFDVLAVSAAGPETESLRIEGIPHQVIPMTRKITPWQDLKSLIGLIRIVRKFKPQIVHTHTPKAGLLGMLAAWLCRIPVRLHTVAGLPLMEARGNKRKLLLLTEKITYACATTVYPNSKGLLDFIQANISVRTPMKMIANGSSNGIDTAHFRSTEELRNEAGKIRSRYHIKETDIVFSFVGRIVSDKGMSELIAAFKKLANATAGSGSRMFLLLIGGFEQHLDPLAEEDFHFLNKSPDVILAGFQQDVRPWIMASDVFVFPSYREGFPNVVLQACCLGIPAIVSDINGSNEIIHRNETGLIVPAKDVEKLFEAMKEMAADPIKRKMFSARARDFVVSRFEQQHVWNGLLSEYRLSLKK
jgi:glycosyltransferase involved in cell wall biosynthesis